MFGVSFLLRVVGVATGHSWFDWVSPLGWVDRIRPLDGVHAVPLVVGAALVVACVAAAVVLGGRIDLGSGLLRPRNDRRRSMRLLGSAEALSLRSALPTAAGWALGLATMTAVLGLVAHSVGDVALRSAAIRGMAERIGATDGGRLFLGVAITLVTAAVALSAAGWVASMRETETARRLDVILAMPVSRTRWLAGRAGVAVVVTVVLASLIGVDLWITTGLSGSPISFPTSLAAGVNVAPAALFVLGLGVLFLGMAPRAAPAVGYALVAWSFLVQLVGGLLDAPGWLLDLSVLHHVAVAPAAAPRWPTNAVLVAFGCAGALVGLAGFRRRDTNAA